MDFCSFSHVVFCLFMSRLQLMDQREVYVPLEATVLCLQPLPSPVRLALSATALASAALRSVLVVRLGNSTQTKLPFLRANTLFPCTTIFSLSLSQFLLFRLQQYLTFRTLFSWFLLYWGIFITNSEWSRRRLLFLGRSSQARAMSFRHFSAGRK